MTSFVIKITNVLRFLRVEFISMDDDSFHREETPKQFNSSNKKSTGIAIIQNKKPLPRKSKIAVTF